MDSARALVWRSTELYAVHSRRHGSARSLFTPSSYHVRFFDCKVQLRSLASSGDMTGGISSGERDH